MSSRCPLLCFFFFNDTATTEIYTLSLHDALPISRTGTTPGCWSVPQRAAARRKRRTTSGSGRSEEHTSELQSLRHLVCRLLLEKKKNTMQQSTRATRVRPPTTRISIMDDPVTSTQ